MKILLIHLGDPCDCLPATSVILGLAKKYNHYDKYRRVLIDVVASDNECCQIFKSCSYVRESKPSHKIPRNWFEFPYDIASSIWPSFDIEKSSFNSKKKLGFGTNKNLDILSDALLGNKKTSKNIFQIYYNLCDMKWKGEGYGLNIRPNTKNKKNKTGLAIANANLREYIVDKLHLDESKLSIIPYRKNMRQKINEINRCGRIVTDNMCTMHIALALRKEVHFLKTIPLSFRLEMFGSGKVFTVPTRVVI